MRKHRFWLLIPYLIIQFSWGIIQNLAGAAIFVYLHLRHPGTPSFGYGFSVVTPWRLNSCLGLGIFIFADRTVKEADDPILVHEYGHNIQSLILGPLFMPVIGIPSMLWCGLKPFHRLRRKKHISYYSFYTEKWANALGKTVTGKNTPK
ncbi:MAG: hypothetical protein MJ137_05750 [Clostridia bacterium]|nr:hypothetical protein [Clostridia bacterium]